ncbi:hypothetical protein [Bacteroides helcogenes]|uniref:Metanogen output domain-containing protein n=1 Tax=Bacteroides helcogenes (strain ATCC 35417 / DSM 20613 / JCM 6297 / CCUG 15421 / P 36-108) TaxID=693979 RepID=E6SQC6_BACT6|nr:hypothetical protein [Bacteroides helcogenes]ADV44973.1 hypothetical protein Bache_3044 [Bacteroides helcogenes P 36-108]MDY5239832.1 hypothetical protein [Bacteroides helcogenes]
MNEENLNQARSFYSNLEQQIATLPAEQQGHVFRKCAIHCVSNTVLPFLRNRYENCGGDMDLFFSEKENSEYSFQKVVEKGHIYEMGYPRCLCFMHDMGFATSQAHCECSRQSILYILHELFPMRNISVEMVGTVLGGADKCTFRIMVGKP